MSDSILVILPTYNEIENLSRLAAEIFSPKIPNLEILVVDDQSPDGTGEEADRLLADRPGTFHVIHRKPPRGRGLAGIDGFIWARDHGYTLALEMDADFSHPPKFIPDLLAPFQDNPAPDLVIGSRYTRGGQIEGWPLWRHINSAVANRAAKFALGLGPKDCTSGYRCFSRTALEAIPWESLCSTGPAIVEEMLYHFHSAGLVFVEIPITFIERTQGSSKVSIETILRWMKEVAKIKRNAKSKAHG